MTRARGSRFARIIAVLIVCLPVPIAMSAATPDGLAAFVNKTAADMAASPLQVPQFKNATLDAIEDLGKPDGTARYLCWLKTDPNRVGYIAVASNGKSFQVLAFSATVLPHRYFGYRKSSEVFASSPATSSPGYFLKHLHTAGPSPKSLDFSRVDHLSFVEDVPLVAAARTFWGTQPLEMSEAAASLSSLFNHMQNGKGILFFGHPRAESNPEYRQRILGDSVAGRMRQDPNRRSFEDEHREAKSRVKIPQSWTDEENAAYRVQIQNLVRPIIRRALLDPVNAYERLNALQAEQDDSVTLIDISPGMKDAVILQMDYLEDGPANIKNLELFLKTRGRATNMGMAPFAKMPADSLPCVLIGPDNIAAIVLGNVNIDGEPFSLAFFPKTGKPNRMSLADAIRVRGGGLVDPNRGRNAEERERLARAREKMETTIIAEDPKSNLPDSLSVGVHVCRTSSLAQWQVIVIGKIEVGPNWGKATVKSEDH
jgi:hypothetical protein